MKLQQLLLCLVVMRTCVSTHLPSTFKKCNKRDANFEQCLIEALEDALGQLDKPFPELNLPSFNPYQVQSVILPPVASIHVNQRYESLNISGFTNPGDVKCSTFLVNFNALTMNIKCKFQKIRIDAIYEFDGKILKQEVHARGIGYAILENATYSVEAKYKKYQREDGLYIKIVDSKVEVSPERFILHLNDLFGEDKVKGYRLNRLFKENGLEVFRVLIPQFLPFYNKLFYKNFNNVLDVVSLTELFGNDY